MEVKIKDNVKGDSMLRFANLLHFHFFLKSVFGCWVKCLDWINFVKSKSNLMFGY